MSVLPLSTKQGELSNSTKSSPHPSQQSPALAIAFLIENNFPSLQPSRVTLQIRISISESVLKFGDDILFEKDTWFLDKDETEIIFEFALPSERVERVEIDIEIFTDVAPVNVYWEVIDASSDCVVVESATEFETEFNQAFTEYHKTVLLLTQKKHKFVLGGTARWYDELDLWDSESDVSECEKAGLERILRVDRCPTPGIVGKLSSNGESNDEVVLFEERGNTDQTKFTVSS